MKQEENKKGAFGAVVRWKAALEYKAMEALRRWAINRLRLWHLDMNPRRWSNSELRRIGAIAEGDVVNVSGWKDQDKEGGVYKSYFTKASSYTITNYYGSSEANDGAADSVFLDLSKPLPSDMQGKYDVAFSHTILEHISDPAIAIGNMARMTRDLMVLVVPFMQDEHYSAGLYGDYWRYTPMGLKRLLDDNGMSVVYMNANDTPWYPIYICCVASKHPDRWRSRFGPDYDWDKRVGKVAFHFENSVW